MCKVCEIQISVFINNVLLEHSHAYFLGIVYGCSCATIIELNSCAETVWPMRPKIFMIWPYKNVS